MTIDDALPPEAFDSAEDRPTNPSRQPTMGDVVARRFSRRTVLTGALAVTAIDTVIGPLFAGSAEAGAAASKPSFDFVGLPAGSDDMHHVAEGHKAQILIRWGDPVLPGAPPFDPARPSAEAQALQFGYNNDFIGYVPLDGRSDHGLLVVNHEYTNDELMYPEFAEGRPRRQAIADQSEQLAAASKAAHGGSVLEVEKTNGTWAVVGGSKYARRITPETPMRLTGPAAGHELLKTSADSTGTAVQGMLNNCAGGVTPWGTWLSCEENINYYFWNTAAAGASRDAAMLARFGIPEEYYPWGRFEKRFDVGAEPNECNRFGWVVEIDPKDPTSTPVKRTALGRFKHEGAGNIVNRDGRFVVYMGDDQKFEYVYKFVSADQVDTSDPAANKDLLDTGTLYVARFDADGRGEWMPLTDDNPMLADFGGQGRILIHARRAADILGATPMDRPEDIEANPKTGKVYVNLTMNKDRASSGSKGVNAANPRPANLYGHIIEITPDGGDHAATGFRWEILVRCGDPANPSVRASFNPATTRDGWFGMPDNCAVDADGRLWIASDGNSLETTGRGDGLWSMETEGPLRGTSKLFFRCPIGAEMCGPYFTPDLETLFVSVQHPGESEDARKPATFGKPWTRWPDFKDGVPPRPSVVAITRKGGGRIA